MTAKKKTIRRGRPPLPPAKRRKYVQITLPASVIDQARELGDGVVSAGVELAVVAEYRRRSKG